MAQMRIPPSSDRKNRNVRGALGLMDAAGDGGPMSPGGAILGGQSPGSQPDTTHVEGDQTSSNTESPRELHPQAPTMPIPMQEPQMSPPSVESRLAGMQKPGGPAGAGAAMQTPEMPMSPTPQAGAMSMPGQAPGAPQPQPFQAAGGAAGMGGGMPNMTAFQAPNFRDLLGKQSRMYGHAGGLQGGGLGAPGASQAGEGDISPLLALIASLNKSNG